jgi:5-methylthioadenosine/S-adenosylhomocysteine deaminase
MDLCAKLHKVIKQDPTVCPASQVLDMATRKGAAVLGLGDEIGVLAAGRCADLVLLDLEQPHLTPFYNADLLVYAAKGSDVRTVIVDGRVVVRDREVQTFDVGEAMERITALAKRVRERA